MKIFRSLSMVLLLITSTAWAASPPALVNYQGVLRDASGAPLGVPAPVNADMVFTFYSAVSGGDQVLVDSHTAADGSPVSVSNGLFTTQFGGGAVADGTGPGTYLNLSDVFKAYGTVYVSISVQAESGPVEILSPRIQVISSPYALNADNLDGMDASGFSPAGHTHPSDHVQSHAMTSASDHSASLWSLFYSNASGQVTELALGAAGQVLKSNGVAAAPSWQADSAGAYTGSNGVTLVGSDFQHSDTSAQTGTANPAGTAIEDVALDGFGHITGLVSTNLDPRFVNTTGDTMTGTLTLSPSNVNGLSANITSSAGILSLSNHGAGTPLSAMIDSAGGAGVSLEAVWANAKGANASGTNTGVSGLASGAAWNKAVVGAASDNTGVKYGVTGDASGAGTNYGGYFSSLSAAGTTNYGLYAASTGAATNWAGWFKGNVNVESGKLSTAAPSTSAAGFNLPHGTAPTTPSNGDLWSTTGGVYAQINGSTVGPFTSASGHTHATLKEGTGIAAFTYDGSSTATAAHADLSSMSSTINSGSKVIQNISVDASGLGHIISAGNLDLDTLYFRESETDTRYVNITGDSMTGKLVTPAGTLASAGFNLQIGVTPSAPADGDLWMTMGGLRGRFNGFTTDFLNATSNAQTKNGKLTLDASGTALDVTGTGTVAQFACSSPWANAFLASSGIGITANGSDMGGVFRDDGSSLANIATADYGIEASGNAGGHFLAAASNETATLATSGSAGVFAATTPYSNAYLASSGVGVTANGSDKGGVFRDDSGAVAYLATATYGIEGSGASGGHFLTPANNETAVLATTGSAGVFAAVTPYSNAYLASSGIGITANGSDKGGVFRDDSGNYANVATTSFGIEAYGDSAGGYFKDNNATGYARIGYGDNGLSAYGNSEGAYVQCTTAGGEAYAHLGRLHTNGTYWGVRGFGTEGGAYFGCLGTGGNYAYVATLTHKIQGTGTDSFIQNHPYEKDKTITYSAPESDEVATFTRGSARLVGGVARVPLTPTFKWVTNPDIGLTAHLTPRGHWAEIYTESLTTSELVVKSKDPTASDVVFDYLVYGLRIGFEEVTVVRPKREEAFIPSMTGHRALIAEDPGLLAYNTLARYKAMRAGMGITRELDLSNAIALKAAIHEFDPAADAMADERIANPAGPDAPTLRAPASPDAHDPVRESMGPASVPPRGEEVGIVGTERADAWLSAGRPVFTVKDEVRRGDVLVLNPANGDELYGCFLPADPMVVGIAAEDAPAMGQAQVVQYGTSWVKADATTAPIARGDLLVSSGTLGHAMKAVDAKPGTIIGKALEPLETGTGMIKVLVMLR